MEITKELKDAVELYKSGNEEAFTTIYEESKAYIYTCISNALSDYDSNEDMIDDIMQDTYFAISKSIEKLDDSEKFLGWAATIARRKSYDMIRKSNKYVLLPEEATFDELAADDNRIPEQIVQDAEKQRIVREAIDTELTDNEKACVVGFYYNDMKRSEIAEEFGIPENTVKTNLSRAKKKLGRVIEISIVVALAAVLLVSFLNGSIWKIIKKKNMPAQPPTTTKQEQPTTTRQEPSTSLGDESEDEEEPSTEAPTEPTLPEEEEISVEFDTDFTFAEVLNYENVARYEIIKEEWSSYGRYEYSIVAFDENDNELSRLRYDEEGGLIEVVANKYDENGNCIIYYNGGLVYWDSNPWTYYAYDYDENNNVVRSYTKSYFSETIEIKDYEYTYHTNGKLKTSKEIDKETQSYVLKTYDEQGNMIQNKEWRVSYYGDISCYIDNYSYDNSGRLLKKDEYSMYDIKKKYETEFGDLKESAVYTYDEKGNYTIETITNYGETPESTIRHYVVDDKGRVVATDEDVTILREYIDTTHVDKTDKLFSEGIVTRWKRKLVRFDEQPIYLMLNYNAADEMIRVDNYLGEEMINMVEINTDRDSNGNVTKVTYNIYTPEGYKVLQFDGISNTYEYDSNGNLITIMKNDGMWRKELQYDSEGRVIEEKESIEELHWEWGVTYKYTTIKELSSRKNANVSNDVVEKTSVCRDVYNGGVLYYTECYDHNDKLIFLCYPNEEMDWVTFETQYDEMGRIIGMGKDGPTTGYGRTYTYEEMK